MMYLAILAGSFYILAMRFVKAMKREDFLLVVFIEKNVWDTLLNIAGAFLIVWLFQVKEDQFVISGYNLTLIFLAILGAFGQTFWNYLIMLFKLLTSSIYKWLRSKINNKFKVKQK